MPYVLLLYALFASVFTIAKTSLNYAEPLFLVGTRMFVAGLILLIYQIFIQKKPLRLNFKNLIIISQLAFFNIYLTNILEFWGLVHLTSFKVCFIYSLSPFLAALFSYWILSENLTIKKWLGLVIGVCGCIPILIHQTLQEEAAGHILFFSWPEIFVMMATACSVYGWILLKKLVNVHQLSPLTVNGISMFMGGVLALAHSLSVENWNPLPVTNVAIFVECTLSLIVISNLVCYNLYGILLKRYSATFMAIAGLTTPLFTALFGWIFLGEIVSWPFYVSFFIVLCGLLIFEQEELKRSYRNHIAPHTFVDGI